MKYIIQVFILVFPIGLFSQPVYPNFSGEELIEMIRDYYKPSVVLDYGEARDIMYSELDNINDSVRCVYSDHAIYLPPGVDASTHLYMNGIADGINAEHTYPRSKGADEDNGNAFSDLHHIFPTRTAVNSARNNYPFAEVADELTTNWYYKTYNSTSIPLTNIDEYSEFYNNEFEPREDHKGNVSRAMFYFFTMYQEDAIAADPSFFENQRVALCNWHLADPVDDREYQRTFDVAFYQDNLPNPFILDCSLAVRCYCEDVLDNCSNFPVSTIESNLSNIKVYPNPAKDFLMVQSKGKSFLTMTNNLGEILIKKNFLNELALDLTIFPKGIYFLLINQRVFKVIISD